MASDNRKNFLNVLRRNDGTDLSVPGYFYGNTKAIADSVFWPAATPPNPNVVISAPSDTITLTAANPTIINTSPQPLSYVNKTSGSYSGTGTSFSTNSITTVTGKLYLLAISLDNDNAVSLTTVTGITSGGGITWTKVTSAQTDNPWVEVELWSGVCSSGGTSSWTITVSAGTTLANHQYIIDEVSNAASTGFVVQSVISQNDAASPISGTLSAKSDTNNNLYVIGNAYHTASPGLTVEAGWTEIGSTGTTILNGVFNTLKTAYHTTDITPSYTFTGNAGLIAVELKSVNASDSKVITPNAGTITFTSANPTVLVSNHKVVSPNADTITLTSQTPTILVSDKKTVSPNADVITLSPANPSIAVTNNKVVSPNSDTITFTPSNPTVLVSNHQTVSPNADVITITEQTPTVIASNNKTIYAPAAQRHNYLSRPFDPIAVNAGFPWGYTGQSYGIYDGAMSNPYRSYSWKIAEQTATNSVHYLQQGNINCKALTTYTFSVSLKAGERTRAAVYLFDTGATKYVRAFIDLTTGVIDNAGFVTFTGGSWSVVNQGNGWYRVSVTATTDAATSILRAIVYPALTGTTTAYVGTDTYGIYSTGWSLTETSAPVDYILEAGNNLALYSQEFSKWTKGTGVTPTDFAVTGPDGIPNSASNIVYNTATSAYNYVRLYYLAPSTEYTYSVWIKGVAGTKLRTSLETDGTLGGVGIGQVTHTMDGNWTRYTRTFTTRSNGTYTAILLYFYASDNTANTNYSFQAFGAQVNIGATALDYERVDSGPYAPALSLVPANPTILLSDNKVVSPNSDTITLTPADPTILVGGGKVISPNADTLSLVSAAPTVLVSNHKLVSPNADVITLSAQAPTILVSNHKKVSPNADVVTLTSQNPTVLVSNHKKVSPNADAITLSAQAPTVLVSDNKRVSPNAAVVTFTPANPSIAITTHQVVRPNADTLSLVASDPTILVSDNKVISPNSDTITFTEYPPTVIVTFQIFNYSVLFEDGERGYVNDVVTQLVQINNTVSETIQYNDAVSETIQHSPSVVETIQYVEVISTTIRI